MFNLSLGSPDNPARMSMSTKAKGKAKASINPRPGHTLNHAQPANTEDADGGLKGRDKLSRKRGSATKINGNVRPETRRVRSGDGLRRIRPAKTLKLLRDRQSGTKKRQETDQPAQGAASTGTDLEVDKGSHRNRDIYQDQTTISQQPNEPSTHALSLFALQGDVGSAQGLNSRSGAISRSPPLTFVSSNHSD